MNTLHIIEGIDTQLGGLPVAMFSIRQIEEQLQIRSHILSIQRSADAPAGPDEGWHLFSPSFPKRFSQSSDALHWLKTHIDDFDLIVIHGFWNFLCLQAALLAATRRKKYVIWPHGSLDPFDLQKKKALKTLLGYTLASRVLEGAERVCFTSEQESRVVETYRAAVTKAVLPLPVESVHFDRPATLTFRQRYDLTDTDFVFLFLGRINYKKGLDTLIRTMEQLYVHGGFDRVRLVVAGHDKSPYADEIKALVGSLGLSAVVRFCGELTGAAKAEALYASDCFVLPSLNENFGIAIIEALQHALPVIVSNNVYIWQEIMALNGGWVCAATDDSLRATMQHVLINRADYIDKKAAAQAAGDHFLAKNLLQRYKDFYHDLACA